MTEACQQVGGSEFPTECGLCNPLTCSAMSEDPTTAPTGFPTMTPTTPPIPAEETFCGCNTCAASALENDANGYSCGARISYLQSQGKTMTEACQQVGGSEFPTECGACNPLTCNTTPEDPTTAPTDFPTTRPTPPDNPTTRFNPRTKCGVSAQNNQFRSGEGLIEALDQGPLAFSMGWTSETNDAVNYSKEGMTSTNWLFNSNDADRFVNDPIQAGENTLISPILVGINEPDGVLAGGSVPEDPILYARKWVDMVNVAKRNGYLKMSGPQVASGGLVEPDSSHPYGEGLHWMKLFMQELDSELERRISNGEMMYENKKDYLHYLSYHIYEPNCGTSAEQIADWQLNNVMNQWDAEIKNVYNSKGFNIEGYAITEIACAPWSSGGTVEGQMKFAGEVLGKMLEDPRLQWVSWFSGVSYGGDWNNGAHYLWDDHTGDLTELGMRYLETCKNSPPPSWEV